MRRQSRVVDKLYNMVAGGEPFARKDRNDLKGPKERMTDVRLAKVDKEAWKADYEDLIEIGQGPRKQGQQEIDQLRSEMADFGDELSFNDAVLIDHEHTTPDQREEGCLSDMQVLDLDVRVEEGKFDELTEKSVKKRARIHFESDLEDNEKEERDAEKSKDQKKPEKLESIMKNGKKVKGEEAIDDDKWDEAKRKKEKEKMAEEVLNIPPSVNLRKHFTLPNHLKQVSIFDSFTEKL